MNKKAAIQVFTIGLVLAGGLMSVEADQGEYRSSPAAKRLVAGGAQATEAGVVAQVEPRRQGDPEVVHTPEGVRIRRGVDVSRFDTVSLNVQDADLRDVLQLLSVQSQRSIIPTPRVSGRVTANLFDVTFYEALSAILEPNNAGFIEREGIIYVYTQEELARIREAERALVHRIFRLDYMTAADARDFITPLLSRDGRTTMVAPLAEGFEPSLSLGGVNSNAHGEIMLVRDYPENMEEIARLITELDTPPMQVLVEATILQANLNEDLALGVDLAILADLGVAAATAMGPGGPMSIVNNMISGDISDTPTGGVTSPMGNTAQPGGVKVGILTHNVSAFVRALDQVTDTVILANPKVMTLNRQRANVLVGDKIAYLSTTATATATTQTVQFLDTGTQLTLRPFVSRDGRIRLELKPSISSATLRTLGDGQQLPDERTQELVTNVMVQDGQTVVLGGLFQEETTLTRRQVPGLGDIPLAGWAFKGKEDTVARREVIFLITPHIVKDQSLKVAGDAALEGAEQLRIGAREGLLGFSRSKMNAGRVRDALRYMDEGETDKALWEVDRALSLEPGLVEARRIKERLTGERLYWPTGSLLDQAVDLIVDDQMGQRAREQAKVVPDPLPALPQRPPGFVPGADKAADPSQPKVSELRTIRSPRVVAPGPDVPVESVQPTPEAPVEEEFRSVDEEAAPE